MSSARVLFCDLCVIMLFGMSFVFAEDNPSSPPPVDEGPKGNCSCGGFPSSTIQADSLPLLSQASGLIVKCDKEGETTCKSLCNALAIATKAKGPEVLCNRLKDANDLILSAFYKICDHAWEYADMTSEEALCCEDSNVKVCSSVERANSTVVSDEKTTL